MPRRPKAIAQAEAPAPAATPQPPATPAEDEDISAVLARASGSQNGAFTNALLSDVAALAPVPPNHPLRSTREAALLGAMVGVGPQDTVEGLLAAHVAALSNTALACLRLAANAGATEQASRLRRDAFAAVRVVNETVAALNTKRNGGVVQQRVVVERVLVQEGAALAIGAAVDAKPRD